LTAGSGYDYLTRQVAAMDATEKGHVPLASYYTERGETPGVWIGSGLAGIDGLHAGDPVTAEQMRGLFGVGLHPLAVQRQEQLQGPDLTSRDYLAVTRLGAPFKIYHSDIPPVRVEGARRIVDIKAAAGLPRDWPIPRDEPARVRTEVATEFFTAEHGRPPQDARELAAATAKHSGPQTTAVAGYDLTFSPVKSVSTLWAIAEPAVAAGIEKPTGPPSTTRSPSSNGTPCSAAPAPTVSGRSTCKDSSQPHSPTATAAPETLICTPTSPLPTRSKPSTDAGSASTAGSYSKPLSPHRKPTTPP
jgi:TrwC relaxase